MDGGALTMSVGKRILLILFLSAFTTTPGWGLASASPAAAPYDGLTLLYDLNLPILSPRDQTSFGGSVRFTFQNVTSTSTGVKIEVEGLLTTAQGSRGLKLTQAAAIPMGVNTILYLKPECDPQGEKWVKIEGIPLIIDGEVMSMRGVFQYEGDLPLTTPAGQFTTYRLRNQTILQGAALDTYLHYDKVGKILVYAEVKATVSLLTYSYTMRLRETNMVFPSGGKPSACLVATAFYGTPLSLAVQELRRFRDEVVLKTSFGAAFMAAFNDWYYRFSPAVAEAERENAFLRAGVRFVLQPLLLILKAFKRLYEHLPFNPEVNMLLVWAAISPLIGAVYLSPPVLTAYAITRARRDIRLKGGLVMAGAFSLLTGVFAWASVPTFLTVFTWVIVAFSVQAGALGAVEPAIRMVERLNINGEQHG
jgi:hypothetical protein